MPLSYRNLIDTNALSEAITSGDFSNVIKNKNKNLAKYIKGYAEDTAIEALANSTGTNLGLIKQAFGIEEKELDAYDPYHTSDAKKEEFWKDEDGKAIQKTYDEDTNTFKRNLYSNEEFTDAIGGYRDTDFWYEDPTYPMFELFFDDESPLFAGGNIVDVSTTTSVVPGSLFPNLSLNKATPKPNSIYYFLENYKKIDSNGYESRYRLWTEFYKVFFKIFETTLNTNKNRRLKNKSYYVTKIAGLNNLNKKIANFEEDKITITINEDVSYYAYYISELYNNLVYSYRNKRYMFPENAIRFDMSIKINDIRMFQVPETINDKTTNVISTPSNIIYTLHDCTFDFFESRNYQDEIVIGGYNAQSPFVPQELSFNIKYKSVTRSSSFPLIQNSLSIDAWEDSLYTSDYINSASTLDSDEKDKLKTDTLPKYFNDLDRIRADSEPEKKSFLNNLLAKGAQTVVNTAANYADNLETSLREKRGGVVNSLLSQFRSTVNINKIEPDNVYNQDFNNRTSVTNALNGLGSNLLNDLEEGIRGGANF